MGCIGSRVAFFRSCSFTSSSSSSRQDASRQNIFAVQNVDDSGQRVSPGKLEVTETDLVLHVKGKPPLTWPLRCLRRYGFDNDLFSFESGRRCPTGAGIFAFRCTRAQSLFNLLQAKIQGNPGGGGQASIPTLPSTPISPTNSGTPVNSGNNNSNTAASTPASSTFVYVNLAENSSSRLLAAAASAVAAGVNNNSSSSALPSTSANEPPPDVVQTPSSTVIPGNSSQKSGQTGASASSFSNRGPHQTSSSLMSGRAPTHSENHPVYMNIESHGGVLFAASSNYQNTNIPPPPAPRPATTLPPVGPSSSSSTTSSTANNSKSCAVYSNVFCNQTKSTASTSFSTITSKNFVNAASSSSYVNAIPRYPSVQQEPAEINYAELDLKTDRPSSSSSSNSPYSSRLGLINKHHHLLLSSSSAAVAGPSTSKAGNDGGGSSSSSSGGSGSSKPTSRPLGEYPPPRLTSKQQNNGDLGYATIDFDKTAALSMITRKKITLGYCDDEDEKPTSSKKSRHGSTGL